MSNVNKKSYIWARSSIITSVSQDEKSELIDLELFKKSSSKIDNIKKITKNTLSVWWIRTILTVWNPSILADNNNCPSILTKEMDYVKKSVNQIIDDAFIDVSWAKNNRFSVALRDKNWKIVWYLKKEDISNYKANFNEKSTALTKNNLKFTTVLIKNKNTGEKFYVSKNALKKVEKSNIIRGSSFEVWDPIIIEEKENKKIITPLFGNKIDWINITYEDIKNIKEKIVKIKEEDIKKVLLSNIDILEKADEDKRFMRMRYIFVLNQIVPDEKYISNPEKLLNQFVNDLSYKLYIKQSIKEVNNNNLNFKKLRKRVSLDKLKEKVYKELWKEWKKELSEFIIKTWLKLKDLWVSEKEINELKWKMYWVIFAIYTQEKIDRWILAKKYKDSISYQWFIPNIEIGKTDEIWKVKDLLATIEYDFKQSKNLIEKKEVDSNIEMYSRLRAFPKMLEIFEKYKQFPRSVILVIIQEKLKKWEKLDKIVISKDDISNFKKNNIKNLRAFLRLDLKKTEKFLKLSV